MNAICNTEVQELRAAEWDTAVDKLMNFPDRFGRFETHVGSYAWNIAIEFLNNTHQECYDDNQMRQLVSDLAYDAEMRQLATDMWGDDFS